MTAQYNDSISNIDTISNYEIPSLIKADSTKKNEKDILEEPVKYSAKDSFVFDMENKTVHLYGNAKVEYQNINLEADYIEFNMSEQCVYAIGTTDSTGKTKGNPIFKDKNDQFEAKWIKYNFKTKKGFVYFVKTKQGEGYLIGDSTKRDSSGIVCLKEASYSTCDLDHPHFYLKLTKAKMVPDDKVVSGPAYLVVADIPLKMVFIPFGFFPNIRGISSGIIFPTFGDDYYRGFSLRDGGYYFAISDYVDARVLGEIYSKGSWGVKIMSNYKRRYRYTGSINLAYNQNVNSEKGLPDYSVANDYKIDWSHSQDSKANPYSKFSSKVYITSSSYDRRNSYNVRDHYTNTRSSSINYSRSWPNSPFNFSASLNHNQDNRTKTVNMTLPQMSLSTNAIYPFRKEESSTEPKWYENIQFTYNAEMENKIKTYDSLFFKKQMFDKMQNGFKHSIPLSLNIKITRSINVTPSINYQGVAYTEYETYQWNPTTYNPTTQKNGIVDTTIHKGLTYAHALYPSISTGYNPKLYGMFMFKNSKIVAIRHVMSPSVGISFIPDFSKYMPNYYYYYKIDSIRTRQISKFANNIYGTPSPAPGKSVVMNLALRNNFEMKYKAQSDTGVNEKKISLLDNLDFQANYDFMADSFNLSNISMSTSTRLFGEKLSLNINGTIDPYKLNENGRRINSYVINDYKKIGRLTSLSLSISTSFNSSDSKSKQNEPIKKNNEGPPSPPTDKTQEVDFSVPWNLSLSYSLTYSKPQFVSSINHSATFNGNITLTKKWSFTFNGTYDFTAKEMVTTSIGIVRDLHCWQMSINVIPFGRMQSYFFTINAKANILRDLKYTKNNEAWRSKNY